MRGDKETVGEKVRKKILLPHLTHPGFVSLFQYLVTERRVWFRCQAKLAKIIMEYTFIPQGVCSRQIDFEMEDGKVKNVRFTGGCDGNLTAISKLIEGEEADKIISILEGNTCGFKDTSCADQLTKALKKAQEG